MPRDCQMTSPSASPAMKVFICAASLRAESLNRKLAALAARVAGETGATVDLASMREFDVPIYDGDLERRRAAPTSRQGVHAQPAATLDLRLHHADGSRARSRTCARSTGRSPIVARAADTASSRCAAAAFRRRRHGLAVPRRRSPGLGGRQRLRRHPGRRHMYSAGCGPCACRSSISGRGFDVYRFSLSGYRRERRRPAPTLR